MVAHQDFSILAELVSQEDAPFIFLLVFKLEDEVESGNFLFYLRVVTPADFVEILILDIAVDNTFT